MTSSPVDVWIDVICPWAYLGQDRTRLLRTLGFTVRSRPFELHPSIPSGGIEARPEAARSRTARRIADECAEAGLPFAPPSSIPNSHLALCWIEAVAAADPGAREAVVEWLFAARFADGRDLGDRAVIDEAALAVGVDPDLATARLADGTAEAALDASVTDARDHGIAATPAWRFANGFVLPGVQPREQVERWGTRLLARSGAFPDPATPAGRIHT